MGKRRLSRLATARISLLGVLLAGAWVAPAPAEDGTVYQWTDGEGIVRYTDDPGRIPRSERDTMLRLEPGMPAEAPVEAATPAGTIPSMLGGALPEGATADPDAPSLTTTAPTSAPAPRTGGESAIGQPIPAPDAAAGAPALKTPAPPPEAAEDEQGAAVRPAGWGEPGGWRAPTEGDARDGGGPSPAWGVPDPYALAAGPAGAALAQVGPEAEDADLDARIRSLESAIARDEERLKDMISDSNPSAVPDLQGSPELREIARRLPGLQAELAELKRERATGQEP